jgi:hypothetical protein
LVWYRVEGEPEDRVRGVARNWQRAESMAKTLHMHLVAMGTRVVATGVKRGSHGEIYSDEGLSLRWSVVPYEENPGE